MFWAYVLVFFTSSVEMMKFRLRGVSIFSEILTHFFIKSLFLEKPNPSVVKIKELYHDKMT